MAQRDGGGADPVVRRRRERDGGGADRAVDGRRDAMSAARIGLCEDDADLRSVLVRTLRGEGFEVRATMTGHEAVEAFSSAPPDLLVLDVGLPDADGRDVCQALRGHGVGAPVIFLTARDALTDRLAGFHAGGDDYLTKPFALAELIVRVRALLRRSGAGEMVDTAGLRLDPAAHAARVGERSAQLTPTEFRLLAALVARPREVLRRRELVAAAWPDGAIVHDNTLDAYTARLRRKLAVLEAVQRIETVRGVGYVLR
ncbi:response regulator transcription factor [Conexibacter sp. CPCC 206217]|uniref:response regulator transcription factor n=1 Tax=Conexibacter sp. CPCC 206217 TaxID=3064574 RepID=UPI002721DC48|nr:response regulator transcription factor [Conexibacter sp. CPCC 206217]MDO8212269.1 response regulator transcription factor [Conexibacter sp. CPCC 206217]